MKMPMFVTVAALAVLALASPAAAVERPLDSWEVTPGETCTLVETNGRSVWPGNVLVINNGGTIIELANVEDVAFESDSVQFVAAGNTVSASVRYDEWSSLEVSLTCEPEQVTTTTAEGEVAGPTTVPELTTTTEGEVAGPTTSTTTAPTTAAPTTAGEEVAAPTTVDEEVAAPTTAAPTTAAPTTAAPTTAAPTTAGEEVAGPTDLPLTGSNTPMLLGLGGLMLAAGIGLVTVKRHAA